MSIYNGRRKVNRLAEEVKDLAKHGVMIKPELQGEAKVTAIRLFLIMCSLLIKYYYWIPQACWLTK